MGFFILCLVSVILLLLYLKPKDNGRPHDNYFSELQNCLKQQGPGHPSLILDLDRLNHNIAVSQHYFNNQKTFRIVAKSLPCLALIDHIFKQTKTSSIMVFHRPFLSLMIDKLPKADFLLGKPFPLQTANHFYKSLPKDRDIQSTSDRIQWLIDSHYRAIQYLELAQKWNIKLRINLEIDIGLHRGGFKNPKELDDVLDLIKNHADHLIFSGFMGYEPHIAKAPMANTEKIETTRLQAMDAYQAFITRVKLLYPSLYHNKLTFNGAGSPTYQLYQHDDTLNDVCLGSSLVQPTDFDLKTINNIQPALFIATPVIKKLHGTQIPYLEKFTPWLSRWNPNWKESIFIYGGYWKAKVCSPLGLANNSLYGRSSNQELMTMSSQTQLQQDDYVFLRPTQSEAVMLEFTEILVVQNGNIVDRWPVFSQESLSHS